MRRRYRKALGLAIGGAIVALPPYGDEEIGIAVGSAIIGTKGASTMDDTSTYQRGDRARSGGGDNAVARWVGIIVIGSIVILAIQVGGLRSFVQH